MSGRNRGPRPLGVDVFFMEEPDLLLRSQKRAMVAFCFLLTFSALIHLLYMVLQREAHETLASLGLQGCFWHLGALYHVFVVVAVYQGYSLQLLSWIILGVCHAAFLGRSFRDGGLAQFVALCPGLTIQFATFVLGTYAGVVNGVIVVLEGVLLFWYELVYGWIPTQLDDDDSHVHLFISFLMYTSMVVSYVFFNVRVSSGLQAENQVNLEQTRQISILKSNFIAHMSHEIRTPVVAITGIAELLLREPEKSVARRQTRMLASACRTLRDVLHQVLDFSSLEGGQGRVELAAVDVSDLMAEMEALFSEIAKEKNVVFSVSQTGNLPPNIQSDRAKLKQVMINLVSNALKFTHTGSVMVVLDRVDSMEAPGPHPRGHFVRLIVRDTGIGMTQTQIDHIFEAFYQADLSDTRAYGGVGLGLYIASSLIKLLSGKVKVTSTLGDGTEFSVVFPLGDVDEEETAPLKFPLMVETSAPSSAPLTVVSAGPPPTPPPEDSVSRDGMGSREATTPLEESRANLRRSSEPTIDVTGVHPQFIITEPSGEAFHYTPSERRTPASTPPNEREYGPYATQQLMPQRAFPPSNSGVRRRHQRSRSEGHYTISTGSTPPPEPVGAVIIGTQASPTTGYSSSIASSRAVNVLTSSGRPPLSPSPSPPNMNSPGGLLAAPAVRSVESYPQMQIATKPAPSTPVANPPAETSTATTTEPATSPLAESSGEDSDDSLRDGPTDALQATAPMESAQLSSTLPELSEPPTGLDDSTSTHETVRPAAGDESPPPANQAPHVLLVDDSEVPRMVVEMMLSSAGITCVTAENGLVAQDKYRASVTGGRRFDVVLMDCQMPVCDGLEATKEIRKMEKDMRLKATPIIAITANTTEENVKHTAEVGMNDFLAKPFELWDVLSKVYKAMGREYVPTPVS